MSCLLWESEFYEDGQTIGQRIAELVKPVPAEDVARVAVQAKEDMQLRHVPLLLARELMRTKEGRAQAKGLFPRVILRPDDITEFLAIYWKDNKDEPLAKQVKKRLGDSFRKFDEYQLAKYNGGQKAVKLRDALRITRPKPANAGPGGVVAQARQGRTGHAGHLGGRAVQGRRQEGVVGAAAGRGQARRPGHAPQRPQHDEGGRGGRR